MKETELAQKFVDYFSCYDLYFEVDYLSCIDIVAINHPFSIAIEVKNAFNFKVFEQALDNVPHFNYSYIAVPVFKDWSIQKRLCKDYGIGLIVYCEHAYHKEDSIKILVPPKLNRRSNTKLLERLCDRNKLSKPGAKSGDGEKVTAFNVTVMNLEQYVQRRPGCSIKEAINNINHHYHSELSARSNIYQWIRTGVIKTIEIKDRKLFMKPLTLLPHE